MNELDKARKIEASEEVRRPALAVFRKQIAEWGVAVPNVEPLVLDFGLGRFASIGLVECWIANEIQAGYCGKYLFVRDGQTCPMHRHADKHESFFLVEGRARVILNGGDIDLRKGDVLAVSPGSRHQFTGIGPALLLELSQPCILEDNDFDNPDIPIGRK